MGDGSDASRNLVHQANYWLTKRDAGLMTREDEAALRDWLAADLRHVAAFERAQQIFDVIAAIGPGSLSAPASSPPDRRWRHNRSAIARQPQRARWIGGAIAASLALVVIGGESVLPWLQADAAAGIGESRRVELPDGSVALLDSGAAIAFAYGTERSVRLLRGQAAFTVAADPERPFVVEARGGTTTALGTRFIVSRTTPVTRVTVTEHAVRVAAAGNVSDVSAGSSVIYNEQGVSRPVTAHVADADAWTRGKFRFVDRPLREVVAELDRYHQGYIGVIGTSIGALPVNGVFATDDPVGALDTIQRSLDGIECSDRIVLLHD